MTDDKEPTTIRELALMLRERDRQYMQRFEGLDNANSLALSNVKLETAAALLSATAAVGKAEVVVNERFKAIENKIDQVLQQQSIGKGRSEGANWLWMIIAGAIGLGAGVVAAFFHR